MPASLQDRYGMTISTQSQAAAICWQEGLDRLLSQNAGPEIKFNEALEHDDGLAMAHACLGFWHQQRARPHEAKASIQRALALTAGITRRERQQIEIIDLWVQGQGRRALARLTEHLAEFPQDALLMRLAHLLYNRGCSSVGVPNFPPAYLALLRDCAPSCGDDWAFLAEYAFAHHETGALDEAMRLARRSLDLNPTNAVAAHSVTHVYFERGDAASGEDFLRTWLQAFDCPASSYVHLSWHLALFELAVGHYQAALERYERDIRPSVAAKSLATLADGASFMWRLQIYGGAASPQVLQEVRELATPVIAKPQVAFQTAHAALAFASIADREAVAAMLASLQHMAAQGDAFVQDVVIPLVQGIAAFAQGAYAVSARWLEPVFPQLVRIGGSHAQREVFEDTLLEAHLRAEQFDQAEAILAERLQRRAAPRDVFWMGRVQAGQGRREQAQASCNSAAKSWQHGDATAPEWHALRHLVASIADDTAN